MRKSISALLLTTLLILALTILGCQPAVEAPKPLVSDASNTLTFIMPGEGQSYDPNKSLETYSGIVLDHCFERLVTLSEAGDLVPAAATQWTVSADGLVYTFKLRPDAKWSDGRGVTAQDFVYSWLRIITPENKFDAASAFAPLVKNGQAFFDGKGPSEDVGIKAMDDLTLQVTLTAPTSYFLTFISMWNYAPVRADAVAAGGAEWDKKPETYMTNGPYKMSALIPGESLTLVKNEYYWNSKAIAIPFIKTLLVTDVEEAIARFKRGEADGVYQILAKDLRTIPDLESSTHLEPSLSTSFMLLNHENPLIANADFRLALSSMIDRQKIVDDVLLGAGTASRFIVPAAMKLNGEPFNDFVNLAEPPNPDLSQKLIAEIKAGGLDVTRPLRLLYMTSSPDEKSVMLIAQLWEEQLGLKLEIEGLEWPDLFARCQAGDYDIAMFGYGADYAHPMTFLSLFMKNTIVTNLIRWQDEDMHQRLTASMSIQDPQESLENLRALEKAIIDGNHVLPIYNRKVISLMSDRISGWYRDDMSRFNFWKAQIISIK